MLFLRTGAHLTGRDAPAFDQVRALALLDPLQQLLHCIELSDLPRQQLLMVTDGYPPTFRGRGFWVEPV